MRLYILIPGILIALAGLTFTLQGLGIVGPESSFMYRSTSWIVEGLAIFVVGLLVIVASVWKGSRKRT